VKDTRAWDLLIVADEASAALAQRLAAALRQRGLEVSLDAATGPSVPRAALDRARRARFALVLAGAGHDTRFALMAAAPYPGAPVDARALQVGMVEGDEPGLVQMIIQRLATDRGA